MKIKTKFEVMLKLASMLALVGLAGASNVAGLDEAQASSTVAKSGVATDNAKETNEIEELNPFDPNIEERLDALDRKYQRATEKNPWLDGINPLAQRATGGCYRSSCKVFAYVRRSDQKLYLSLDGNPYAEWAVSTGAPGHDTPNFDRHPNGRVYDRYMSSTYPGGDYQGLGNMPYAVFIEGGFAIHGTTKGNWKRLGRKASHGCIRVHPDNAQIFNRLVRQHGVQNVWIQVGE